MKGVALATKQLGTPSERPEDAATVGIVTQKLAESPDVGAAAQAQAVRDAVFSGVTREDSVGKDNNELRTAARNINPESVLGVLGSPNIAESVVAVVEAIAGPGAGIAELKAKIRQLETGADQGARAYVLAAEEHETVTQYYTEAAEIVIESWVEAIDLVAVGRGGDAADGITPTPGEYTQPGLPGNVTKVTLLRDEHFTGTPTLTFTPSNGSGTTFTIGELTITATDGAPGVGTTATRPVGLAPQSVTFKDVLYEFGGDQNVLGGNGTTPGGGANGRHWLLGLLNPTAQGGGGGGYVTLRPAALEGETPEDPSDDTTPPNVDELDVEVTGVTTTSLIITPSGAVDA